MELKCPFCGATVTDVDIATTRITFTPVDDHTVIWETRLTASGKAVGGDRHECAV